MKRLVERGWKPPIAAALLMTGSFVGILIPVTLITIMLTAKIGKAVNNSEKVIRAVKDQINLVEHDLGYSVSSNIDTTSITSWISSNLQNLAGGTFNAFIAIGIMYFMLYYMLINRQSMRESLIEYIPLGKDNLRIIGEESNALVKSNALGIPLVAFVQGVIALVGFLIFGVPDPFLVRDHGHRFDDPVHWDRDWYPARSNPALCPGQ